MTSNSSRLGSPPTPLVGGLTERIHTPALIVDLDAVAKNLDAVLRLTAGPARWRPHVKTAKVPEVLALYARAGVRRFKCATIREAEVLAKTLRQESVPGGDILLAHHLHGPGLGALAQLGEAYTDMTFSTLVEDPARVDEIPASLGLFADIDLGMGRTGSGAEDHESILEIGRAAGERLVGLHAYDGHRHEPDVAQRERLVHASYDGLVKLIEQLQTLGCSPREVITAGTPAFPAALRHTGLAILAGTVHRVSPGTVVYHDLRSVEQLPDLDAVFAATVLTRVVSHPGKDTFTCDAGSKSLEGTGPHRIGAVLGHPEYEILRQSEEHTVLRANGVPRPERGTALRIVPGHVCPTVNLASEAVLVKSGAFVKVAEVTARAHATLVEDA